jgi:hypothetical protein
MVKREVETRGRVPSVWKEDHSPDAKNTII